jgi:glutaredoxin
MKMSIQRCVLLLMMTTVWSFFMQLAQAQFYQYRDDQGRVVISDRPPQGRNSQERQLTDGNISWSSRGEADIPSAVDERLGHAVHREETRKGPDYSDVTVVLYRTSWCGYCKQAAAYVRSLGAELIEYDIEKDADRKTEMRKKSGGSSGVPLLDIDGTIIHGYNPSAIRAAVEMRSKR